MLKVASELSFSAEMIFFNLVEKCAPANYLADDVILELSVGHCLARRFLKTKTKRRKKILFRLMPSN